MRAGKHHFNVTSSGSIVVCPVTVKGGCYHDVDYSQRIYQWLLIANRTALDRALKVKIAWLILEDAFCKHTLRDCVIPGCSSSWTLCRTHTLTVTPYVLNVCIKCLEDVD